MFFKGKNLEVQSLFVIGVGGYIVQYFMMLYLSIHLTPTLFGDISLGFKSLILISQLLLFGTTTSSTKIPSKLCLKNNTESEEAFVQWNLKLIQKTSIFGFIFFVIFITILFFLDNQSIITINQLHPIIYFFIISPFLCLTLLLAAYFSCYKQVILSMLISNILLYVTMFTFMIISVFLFETVLNNHSIPIIVAIVCIIITLSELLLLNKFKLKYKISLTSLFRKIKPKYSELHSSWYKTSQNFAINLFVFTLVSYLDLLILELFGSNEHIVGYLAACSLISGFIWLIPQTCYNNIVPKISYLMESEKGKKTLQSLLNKSSKLSFSLTLLIAIIIIIFKQPILSTFGSSYTQAQIPLLFLLIAGIFGVLQKPIALLLNYAGHERFLFIINSVMLVIFLIIGIPATYLFGINGIAATNIVAYGFLAIALYLKYKKHFKIKPFIIF